MAINTGRVIGGGLVAGLVMNVVDFVTNTYWLGSAFAENAVARNMDPKAMESASGIATFVVVDFLFGLLCVWTYAAMRPRFGPGPKTAIFAALPSYLGVTLIMYAMSGIGLFPVTLWMNATIAAALSAFPGSVVGCWLYQE